MPLLTALLARLRRPAPMSTIPSLASLNRARPAPLHPSVPAYRRRCAQPGRPLRRQVTALSGGCTGPVGAVPPTAKIGSPDRPAGVERFMPGYTAALASNVARMTAFLQRVSR